VPVYQAREEPLNQGDIFADVPFTVPVGDYERTGAVHPGLVVSHDCDCDKAAARAEGAPPDLLLITVVPVYPLSRLAATGQAGDIREGRISRYFYLPAEGDLEEQCADFWLEQPAPLMLLRRRPRRACLSDEYRGLMLLHIWRLRARDTPPPQPPSQVD
jgi:hypothetical protein